MVLLAIRTVIVVVVYVQVGQTVALVFAVVVPLENFATINQIVVRGIVALGADVNFRHQAQKIIVMMGLIMT